MRPLAIALVLLLAACSREPTDAETCAPRVERMRHELASSRANGEPPSDAAPWVAELYARFVAT
ncbi:MAG TPA: hypothetical protein VFG69_05805, partial [Nannocystaceae bacterium]|nr:hypothetical protein [Nannocystaceae bacterium]